MPRIGQTPPSRKSPPRHDPTYRAGDPIVIISRDTFNHVAGELIEWNGWQWKVSLNNGASVLYLYENEMRVVP